MLYSSQGACHSLPIRLLLTHVLTMFCSHDPIFMFSFFIRHFLHNKLYSTHLREVYSGDLRGYSAATVACLIVKTTLGS